MALKAHTPITHGAKHLFVRRVHQNTRVLGGRQRDQRVAVNRRIVILVDCWAGLHRHVAA